MKQVDSIYNRSGSPVSSQQLVISRFVSRTYGWMFIGLLVTGLISLEIAGSANALQFIFGNKIVFYLLMFAEIGLVLALTAWMPRLSASAAMLGFLGYSALNGVTLSIIFLTYSMNSIGQVFLISAGMFGGLAFFGTVTRKDLTGMGSFVGMGVWGLILVGLVNLWIQSDALSMGMAVVGVLVFSGLTAYNAQQIRALACQYAGSGSEQNQAKGAIFGALTLYLNFINLFLSLLRLFGSRRN